MYTSRLTLIENLTDRPGSNASPKYRSRPKFGHLHIQLLHDHAFQRAYPTMVWVSDSLYNINDMNIGSLIISYSDKFLSSQKYILSQDGMVISKKGHMPVTVWPVFRLSLRDFNAFLSACNFIHCKLHVANRKP